MLRGARSAIRNGRDTLFWTTRWIDSGDRLINLLEDDNADIQMTDSVADFVTSDGQWDIDRLSSSLPINAVDLVVGMTLPREDRGEDQWVWGEESHGRFSIRSAYRLICNQPALNFLDPWKSVWRWKGPNRIRVFLWLAVQDRLLTNKIRARRHMTTDAACPRCRLEEEDTSHVLRDCAFAREVWGKFPMFDSAGTNWHRPFSEWICVHLNSRDGGLFGVVCWILWRTRNEWIFSAKIATATEVYTKAFHWTSNIESELANIQCLLGDAARESPIEVAWDPGEAGWVSLYTDGSADRRKRKDAAGGLLRDFDGRCIMAYSMNLGNCSITRAEMRGAVEGLRRAWELGYRRILLRMDSLAAISLLTGAGEPTHQHGLETVLFQELCGRDWQVVVKHIF
ncbi:Putative ribonuclease H protein At1g65750 [Linum perenne]